MSLTRSFYELPPDRPLLRFAQAVGVALVLLAAAVMFGWVAHASLLVQVFPHAPPMRFNGAVCLLLLGFALAALGRRQQRVPRYAGASMVLFAGSILSQYACGVDLGVDNLLLRDWTDIDSGMPGRIAINTAIGFVLVGGAVVSLSFSRGWRWQPLFECACGSIVFSVGAVSIYGHLSGLEATYAWSGSIGMAVHTAAAFTLTGITLIGLALVHERCWSLSLPVWLPLPFALAVATMSVAISQALEVEEQRVSNRARQVRAEKLAAQLEGQLKARIESLERMAQRWATAGQPRRDHWEADARQLFRHFTDFQSLEWIDPQGNVAWSIARSRAADACRIDLASVADLQLASTLPETKIIPAFPLSQDEIGGLIVSPIDNGEQSDGCLTAAFRIGSLTADLAHDDVECGYEVQLVDQFGVRYPATVPASRDAPAPDSRRTASEAAFLCGGVPWQVRMRATPFVAAQRSRLPLVVLCNGILVAVMLALAIYYAQRSHERSQEALQVAEELRSAQTRFRAIFDQTFQFTGLLSPDGVVLEANRSALAFAGISEADVLGHFFWETPWWRHNSEQQQRLRTAIAAAAVGVFQRFEATHQDATGETRFVDFSLKPVFDEQGQVTLLIPEGRDVTDRIRIERLQRETQERFELAVRGSSDGIWDWNLETGDTYCSPRFKELLGRPEQTNVDWRDALYSGDRASTLAALDAHLFDTTPFDVICRLQVCDGGTKWFRIRGEAIRAEDGRARRMAGSLSDMTALKQVEEELRRAACLDKLTNLPNRSLLLDRLQHKIARSMRSGRHDYAVMFLDFDRFKIINDSLGHEVGDELLQCIAARLRESIRSVDSVSRSAAGHTTARLGGDEFVVLLDELAHPDDVLIVANRLLAALARPYQLGGHEVQSTASIGITLGSPAYETADDVLRDADTAMYEAKRRGKGQYVVFDDSMRLRVQRNLQLEIDLRKAIGTEQISLVYQPILSLRTGEVRSVEGLLRWQHPTEGPLGPTEFIPIAEESDLIHLLGDWTLQTGCRQMARWIETLGEHAPATISLNLSRKQFAHPALTERIQTALAEAWLPTTRLQVEIPEVALGGHTAATLETMRELRRLGVRLAIDDFGTGTSSFAAMHQFPIHTLKVDPTLLEGLENSPDTIALIHALSVLVNNLGIEMVAEGVESPAQAIALQELGCRSAQGYFIAPPMTAEEFEQFAQQNELAGHDQFTANGSAMLIQ